MNRLPLIALALISATLMIVGWPPLPTAALLFIALTPLFIIRERLEDSKKKHRKFFGYTYITMLLFNTGTTWWVWNASPSGCIMMLVLNSLMMSLPYLAFSHTKQVLPKYAYLGFVLYYLAFEYWHFNWSAAWPWLTLGKGLASIPQYIQWYEYTGELGGTALILSINVLFALAILSKKKTSFILPISILVVFGLVSFLISFGQFEIQKGNTRIECVVSQPNIDPYTEKFGNDDNYLYPEIQLDYAIEPAEPLLTDNTQLLLFPETAIVGYNNESELEDNFLFNPLRQLTDSTKLTILTGAESFSVYTEKERPTITARYDSAISKWFDFYNSAMNIKDGEVKEIYHKSKLVPGVEKMPFAFLEQLSINLGGTSGSLGVSDRPINFTLKNGVKVAPLICYESVFGDYACEYVRDGAQILAVVTNDGWWGETPGYKQHLLYGAIRCIETRREMARSANTGVSAYINQFGTIKMQTKYKERVALKCYLNPKTKMTFYVKYGNLIGKASLISILLLVSVIILKFKKNPKDSDLNVETV